MPNTLVEDLKAKRRWKSDTTKTTACWAQLKICMERVMVGTTALSPSWKILIEFCRCNAHDRVFVPGGPHQMRKPPRYRPIISTGLRMLGNVSGIMRIEILYEITGLGKRRNCWQNKKNRRVKHHQRGLLKYLQTDRWTHCFVCLPMNTMTWPFSHDVS